MLYPDADYHFDGAKARRLSIVAKARGGRGATVDYSPHAHADAEKQVRAFRAAQVGT